MRIKLLTIAILLVALCGSSQFYQTPAQKIFETWDGGLRWNVDHIYVSYSYSRPYVRDPVESRGINRFYPNVTTLRDVFQRLGPPLPSWADRRVERIFSNYELYLQKLGLTPQRRGVVFAEMIRRFLIGAQVYYVGYAFWETSVSGGSLFLNITLFTLGVPPYGSANVKVVLFSDPVNWRVAPKFNFSVPWVSGLDGQISFDPQSRISFIKVEVSTRGVAVMKWNGTRYVELPGRSNASPLGTTPVLLKRSILINYTKGVLRVEVVTHYVDVDGNVGTYRAWSEADVGYYPDGRYVFGVGAEDWDARTVLLGIEGSALDVSSVLSEVYRRLAGVEVYFVKMGDHDRSVLLTAARLAGVRDWAAALSIADTGDMSKVSVGRPSNVSLVRLEAPLARFYVLAINLSKWLLLYDPGGLAVRLLGLDVITSINEDLYVVSALPPGSTAVWLRWDPQPTVGNVGLYLGGYEVFIYGIGVGGRLDVLAYANASRFFVAPTLEEAAGGVARRYVYRFELPEGVLDAALFVDGVAVANLSQFGVPLRAPTYGLQPEVYVFTFNNTVCVRIPPVADGLQVFVGGLPAPRRGLWWCGVVEGFPTSVRYGVGPFERVFYVAPPEVKFYAPSVGLSPLAAVSVGDCGVEVARIKSAQVEPYQFTRRLYSDGIIFAHVYPGNASRDVELVLKDLCASVYYVYRATLSLGQWRYLGAVVFGIDVSNSMGAAGKLDTAKRIAEFLVDLFSSLGVPVGVVTFSGAVRDAVPPTTDYRRVKEVIRSQTAGGSTNIGDALITAYKMIETGGVVVLLTDGRHNVGTPPRQALATVKLTGPTFTIGLGGDVDEEELKWIARYTGGLYFYSPTPQELAAAFLRFVQRWETMVFNGSGVAHISGALGEYVIRLLSGSPRDVVITFANLAGFCRDEATGRLLSAVTLLDLEKCGIGKFDPQANAAVLYTYGRDFTISTSSSTKFQGQAAAQVLVYSTSPTASYIAGDSEVCAGGRYVFTVVNPLRDPAAFIDGRSVPVYREGDRWTVDVPGGYLLVIKAEIKDEVTGRLLKTEEKEVRIVSNCISLKVDPPQLSGVAPARFTLRVALTGIDASGLILRARSSMPAVQFDRSQMEVASNRQYEVSGTVTDAARGYIALSVWTRENRRLADAVVKIQFDRPGTAEPSSKSLTIRQYVGTGTGRVEFKVQGAPQIGVVSAPQWVKASAEAGRLVVQTSINTPGLYTAKLLVTDQISLYPIEVVAAVVDRFVDLDTVKWIQTAKEGLLSLPLLDLAARESGYLLAGRVAERIASIMPPYAYAVYANTAFKPQPAPGWKLLYYVGGMWTTKAPPLSFQVGSTIIGLAPDVRGDVNFDGKVDIADAYLIWKRVVGERVPVGDDVLDVNGDGRVDLQDVVYVLSRIK